MKRSIYLFVSDILNSIDLIENSIKNVKKSDFELDEILRDATIRRLEIIGEAVKNIPDSFRNKYPEINWKEIAGFRDVVIHSYFKIDLDITWDIINRNLPDLKQKILNIKKDLENKEQT